jgi:hypothetical protein
LKPASRGYILPKNFKRYRTKEDKFYLDAQENIDRRIFNDLDVPSRDIYSYTFEDVIFPNEYDYDYLKFLDGVLKYPNIALGLKDKRCFPTLSKKLKKITGLYNYNNIVFRTVFNENLDMFIHHDLLEHEEVLSIIGFKNEINKETLIKCALKIEELQGRRNTPTDIRFRSNILIDHLYKCIDTLNSETFESITRIRFVPISKDFGSPYSINVNRDYQGLYCFNDVILPEYKEVAWSQKPLISEDNIPPLHVLLKYPSLGKPKVTDVIKHLRFLYEIQDSDKWSRSLFKHNVYEVYKWLEKECSDDDDLDLSGYIDSSDRLFLNFNIDQDPFNGENWVSVEDLVLNSASSEVKYVNPDLSIYPNMLKSAGVKEVKRPNVKIFVRSRGESYISKSYVFKYLLDEEFPLNDLTIIVSDMNGVKNIIKTSRYMLAASSEFFRNKFVSNPNLFTITIDDVKPDSVRVLLRYLYDQIIDDAIKSLRDLHSDATLKLSIYKDLLKLAKDYKIDHLKELMELKLSWLVTLTNVSVMKRFAETSKADQLKKYCEQFIIDNNGLRNFQEIKFARQM